MKCLLSGVFLILTGGNTWQSIMAASSIECLSGFQEINVNIRILFSFFSFPLVLIVI
jgi:hypothetical protein